MLHAVCCALRAERRPIARAAELPPELQFCNAYPPEGCTDDHAGGGACYGGRHRLRLRGLCDSVACVFAWATVQLAVLLSTRWAGFDSRCCSRVPVLDVRALLVVATVVVMPAWVGAAPR